MAERYFLVDFPPDMDQHRKEDIDNRIQQVQWASITSNNSFAMFPTQALSQSKDMRAACVQCNIANQLSNNIFQPIWLPTPAGHIPMGQALERSAAITSQEKALLRSLLLKTFASEEHKLRQDKFECVVDDILKALTPLLPSGATQFEMGDYNCKFSRLRWSTQVRTRSDKSHPLYSGCMVWQDKEVAKEDPRKWLAGERTTVINSKALVVREAPQNPHIISKSRRQEKSFAERLTAKMSDGSQNRVNRLSREDENSK
ncbi:hypothetical protein BBP40_007007 [Aspergillus hancockii]|nr:hypothetical protein BBP40_007007 [Aspergillus hancockii]